MISKVNNECLHSTKVELRRKNFGRITTTTRIPNLIQTQKDSYNSFLQLDVNPAKRADKGLEAIFKFIFPLSDFENKATLEYVKYNIFRPKYDLNECMQRGVNYSASLSITVRLIVWDNVDEETREIKSIKEQDVFMGEIPLMTESGTFMINGAQRVIVSQMHRSPGVFYTHDGGKHNSSGKYLYSASIIPYRGSWLDFEFDNKDIINFRIDRKRKLPATALLKAMGYTSDEILQMFYKTIKYEYKNGRWIKQLDLTRLKGMKLDCDDYIDAETGEILVPTGVKITPKTIKEYAKSHGRYYVVNKDEIIGRYISKSVFDVSSGELILAGGKEITSGVLDYILHHLGHDTVEVLDIDHITAGAYIHNTLMADKSASREDALHEIFMILKNGEPPSIEAAELLLHNRFFDKARYDLSIVGRMKMNMKHDLKTSHDITWLTNEDIIAILKYLVDLRDNKCDIDDIDSLSNRRVRPVGELIENQFRLGLVRIERSILERMNSADLDSVMPNDLINSKALTSIIHEFFGTSQLSQFMDQTNPLSEVTHKRRVSALGPGGLARDRAGLAVRDVHLTHYGRICPIETPEGQNTGLINSLATYASIDMYGFIDTPYYKVENGCVTNEVHRLSAIVESKFIIAQANASVDEHGRLMDQLVICRRYGEFSTATPSEVQYIDVSPKQLVSVAAALVPFLENDDANRALMGANMQRQAVPLITNKAPIVGTGMEKIVAFDSGALVIAKRSGTVIQVDANNIVIRHDVEHLDESFGIDMYKLTKYKRSNKGTCINQRPIVGVGDVVKVGDVLADGASTDNGELALGKDVLVAFMPWNGYNFEDSILVSQKLVQDDVFTSIHIQDYEVVARDTRLGPEEITRQIPGVGLESLFNLDEDGIITVGSKVEAGDILVGKITPKTESILTPEEKLLRAIFGEKAAEVRDSSLRVPPGESGTVIGIRVFTRRGMEKNERAILIEKDEMDQLSDDHAKHLAIIENIVREKLYQLIDGQQLTKKHGVLDCGHTVNKLFLDDLQLNDLWDIPVCEHTDEIKSLQVLYETTKQHLSDALKHKMEKVQSGDHFPQGALTIVKVYVATKLRLQPGDKMAGRHGNKGVVSKVVPVEDMPFLEDGTPIDIVLNPLGVPSRMNIGQILETHLGWAAKNLGYKIGDIIDRVKNIEEQSDVLRTTLLQIYDGQNAADCDMRHTLNKMSADQIIEYASSLRDGVSITTPVFDGAREEEISKMLQYAGLDASGQTKLIDGRTGEYFDRRITVGYIHMLKLDHLVANKIHARSTGPYNLVTQQPLGGKQHFGGQRFGEMECWALQAYGAAYTLQEILTVKSDDVAGRVKIYENIIRNDLDFEYGTPESFNVMVKEIRSLCLNVDLIDSKDNGAEDI